MKGFVFQRVDGALISLFGTKELSEGRNNESKRVRMNVSHLCRSWTSALIFITYKERTYSFCTLLTFYP